MKDFPFDTPDLAQGTDALRQLELARAIAVTAHMGQFRRDGETPYIKHVEAVVGRVSQWGGDDQACCIAWLHDVLEDTKETEESLIQAGIVPAVVVAVRALTHRDIRKYPYQGMPYAAYIREIKDNPNPRVPLVKLADIISNLADRPTPRQIKKYGQALGILTSELSPPLPGNTTPC